MDLDGRVVIVSGAGRGIGRADALLLAALGARVVVNDLGGGTAAAGSDLSPADEVVAEIRSAGGAAVANYDDVADWRGARRLIRTAIDSFGTLHTLVNNAGILRNKMLFNSSPADWDTVMRVNLRGTWAPSRWAVAYWRDQRKAGASIEASLVNTASQAGIFGSPGGTNYAASKGGAVMFSVTAARELESYGIRVNAVCPAARSRLTLAQPASATAEPIPDSEFDVFDPANVAPLVAYLAAGADVCPFSGGVFSIMGGSVGLYGGWEIAGHVDKGDRWTVDELAQAVPKLAAGRRQSLISLNLDDPTLQRQLRQNETRARLLYPDKVASQGAQ